jgi:hypothetical protein
MTERRPRWTREDIQKLETLAQNYPVATIANNLFPARSGGVFLVLSFIDERFSRLLSFYLSVLHFDHRCVLPFL